MAWTRPLKFWFFGLQLVGIYLAATKLFALTVGIWLFFSAVARAFAKHGPWEVPASIHQRVLAVPGLTPGPHT